MNRKPSSLGRGLHLSDHSADQLSRRERSRQRRALARPLRAIARFTLGLCRGVEGLARVIGHRISGNLTSGHACAKGGKTVGGGAGRTEMTEVMTVWYAAPLASNARYP